MADPVGTTHDAHGTTAAPSAAHAFRSPGSALALALAASCVVGSLGCGAGSSKPAAGEAALAARLAGLWDAEFVLQEAPTGVEAGGRQAAHGPIALLEGSRNDGESDLGTPVTHVGVYSIDFRPLGFSPPAEGAVSELVAGVILPDSVAAVLPAEAHEGMLELRGVLAGDSVTGSWSYGGRALGGWGGRFVLRRRAR